MIIKYKKQLLRNLGIFFIFSFFLINCKETDLVDESGSLSITNINLPELTSSYTYEGWLLLNGTFVSVGKFDYEDFSSSQSLTFTSIDTSDLASAEGFAITIEETSGSIAPSDFIVMTGDFSGSQATLSATHQTNGNIKSVGYETTVGYTLQIPTNQSTSANYQPYNGLWFFQNVNGTNEATINFDFDAFSDVKLQAWILSDGLYFNMGVISANNTYDDANLFTPYTAYIPSFPGEDFLAAPTTITLPDNYIPLDLRGKQLIVTAIPDSYTSTSIPFPIYLVNETISSDAETGATILHPTNLYSNYTATVNKL